MNWRQETRKAAKRHGLDPDLFEAQIGAESNFDPDVESPAGAIGIAQIMPGTAKSWRVNPRNPRAALNAAAKAMAGYVRKYGEEGALRAYNAGEGAIEKSKGYEETNRYVEKILGARKGGRGRGANETPAKGAGAREVTVPGATLFGIGEEGPSELDAVMGMLQGKLNPLQMAQQVQAARQAPSNDVKLPDTKIEVGGGGGKTPPSRVKIRGKGSIGDVGHEMDAFARRLGMTPGGGVRSVQHNAQVGGAEDSDHLETGYGRSRWARDYPLRGEDALQAKQARIARRYGLDPNDGFAQGNVKIGKHTYRVQVIAGAAHDHADHVHVGFRLVD